MIVLLSIAIAAPPTFPEDGYDAARGEPEQSPPPTCLSEDQWDELRSGEVIWSYDRIPKHDLGMAAQLTTASPERVWNEIVAFDRWVEFLPYVTTSIIEQSGQDASHYDVDARFGLTIKGITTWHDIRHHAFPDERYIAFHLQDDTRSWLKGSTGYWTIEAIDDKTLVTFRADLHAAWWVPGIMRKKAAVLGLPRLVKEMVERAESPRSVASSDPERTAP